MKLVHARSANVISVDLVSRANGSNATIDYDLAAATDKLKVTINVSVTISSAVHRDMSHIRSSSGHQPPLLPPMAFFSFNNPAKIPFKHRSVGNKSSCLMTSTGQGASCWRSWAISIRDGDVDGADFLEWQRTDQTPGGLTDWQAGYPSSLAVNVSAVPEPSSCLLLLFGAAVLAGRRKS